MASRPGTDVRDLLRWDGSLPKPNATPWLWTRTRWKKFVITGMSKLSGDPGGGNFPTVQNFVT